MWTLYFCPVVSSIFFFFLAWSQQSEIGCLRYFHTWCGLTVNLGCRSETCCTWLTGNTGRRNHTKNSPSGRHRTTLSVYIFATKAWSAIGKNLLNSNISHMMSLQYHELRPTSGWCLLASLGHPCKFQRVSCLGIVTARHVSTGHQPNLAALSRRHHRYSTGWPSCWALAHILVEPISVTFSVLFTFSRCLCAKLQFKSII